MISIRVGTFFGSIGAVRCLRCNRTFIGFVRFAAVATTTFTRSFICFTNGFRRWLILTVRVIFFISAAGFVGFGLCLRSIVAIATTVVASTVSTSTPVWRCTAAIALTGSFLNDLNAAIAVQGDAELGRICMCVRRNDDRTTQTSFHRHNVLPQLVQDQ